MAPICFFTYVKKRLDKLNYLWYNKGNEKVRIDYD